MATQMFFLLACLASATLGQFCNCPLVGVITTTTTPACPTGDVLTMTSISTAGACRNPRTTTTTTTRTAGACNCPTQTTVRVTATPDCPNVTSTSTEIEPTIDCPWAATLTQTITQYGLANNTAFPSTASGSAAFTGATFSGTAGGRPTCSLSDLPQSFYIRDALSGYLVYDPSCRKAVGCLRREDATAFHVNETDPNDLGGVPQLSLYYPAPSSSSYDESESEEYGAYITSDGGPMQFFRAGEVPVERDWYIVTAGWSRYLCELRLITWNLHDLSTAEDCGGYLSLGYGFGEDECPETRLTVEAA